MRCWAKVALFVVGSVLAQLALLYIGFQESLKFIFWLLAPGLYAMRLLPNDPAAAGSFIVFPTLPQFALALAVNTAVYGGLYAGFRRFRKT